MNNYLFTEETDDSMELAFNKNLSNKRKDWLYSYDENKVIDPLATDIPIEEFIHKELIHFSNSDTLRSIGSLYDGLKPSQRKILYSCFKRKLYSEIRVAQLAGYVSENAAYHHGEMSLQSAIIGMAQNYTGSNNINILMPNGQFGTRIMGGHDAASSRYIHTELNKLADIIYPPIDSLLLDFNDDDGVKVEPKYYLPIIPMILVNGMNGIGTGFSTSVPKYNPIDVINNIKRKLNSQEYEEIKPWYGGFKGSIVKIDEYNYMSKGVYEIINPTSIRITELPIGKWTDDYKKFLDTLLPQEKKKRSKENENHKKKKNEKNIIDYVNNSSDTEIDFLIQVAPGFIQGLQWSEDDHVDGIDKFFKLHATKGLSLKNIHLYDKQNIIKVKSTNEIFTIFYEERYKLYVTRKQYLLKNLSNSLEILSSKIRFINDIINEELVVYKKKKDEIIDSLIGNNYKQMEDKFIVNNYNDKNKNGYDYLIKMSLYSFTEEEIEKLNNECEKIKSEHDLLKNQTVEEIWLNECNQLIKQYRKYNN